jgi:hypothetical protein
MLTKLYMLDKVIRLNYNNGKEKTDYEIFHMYVLARNG